MPDVLSFNPSRALDANANGSPGAKAYFYDSGTTTLRTVYSDAACTIPHPSPLVADANGTFATAFANASAIKVVITDSAGATLNTIDPCVRVSASGAAASSISFSPTVALPFDNVQAAIEGSVAAAASGFNAFGLGVTGSVALLAALDATNTASGQYRFDGTTTGTFPTGVLAGDTGAVLVVRETSGSAWMVLYHDTTDRRYYRRMSLSVWGTWREDLTANQGFAAGDLLYHNGTNLIRLAKGTALQGLRMNSGATAPEWATLATINQGSALAASGLTNIDFTGIPSTATRITVQFLTLSLSGTDNILIQLGTSGGFVSTGYASASSASSSTAGMIVSMGNAARAAVGQVFFTKITGNTWICSHGLVQDTGGGNSATGGGWIALGAALDRVRVTVSGANTFDGGTVNITWE